MKKRNKRIRHGVVVAALGLTQVVTPIMAIAETTEQEQTIRTLDSSNHLLDSTSSIANEINTSDPQPTESSQSDRSSEESGEKTSGTGSEKTSQSETPTATSSTHTADTTDSSQGSSSENESKEAK